MPRIQGRAIEATAQVAADKLTLLAMASNAPVVGPNAGDGQKVKLVNQLLCGVHIAAAAEALAEALGLDPATCYQVLRHGAAASFMFEDRGRRMVGGTEQVNSALDIFVKDMGLVVDAARHSTYSAPLASAAEQLYLSGHRASLGRRDDSSVIEVLRGPLPHSEERMSIKPGDELTTHQSGQPSCTTPTQRGKAHPSNAFSVTSGVTRPACMTLASAAERSAIRRVLAVPSAGDGAADQPGCDDIDVTAALGRSTPAG